MNIIRLDESDTRVSEFINVAFTDFATKSEVVLNYDEFCFAAEENEKIIGAITGRAYYNEVHINDLIIAEDHRRDGLGSKLVKAVEDAYSNMGYEKITLTTFGFQAPGFYKKLGYEVEFIREDRDPKLSKYFYCKRI